MGLIDSIAYSLAGGVAGGAEQAEQVAKTQIAQENLKELNQQKADVELEAQKRLAEFGVQQQLEARQRVASAVQAATDEHGHVDLDKLNAAGYPDISKEIAGQTEWAGLGYGNPGIVINRQTGESRQLMTPAELAEARGHPPGQAAERDAERRDAANGKLFSTLENQPHGAWAIQSQDPITGKASTAYHPGVQDAYRDLATFNMSQNGGDPYGAISRARSDVSALADLADQKTRAAGLKPGMQGYEETRSQLLRAGVNAKMGIKPPPAPTVPKPNDDIGVTGGWDSGSANTPDLASNSPAYP